MIDSHMFVWVVIFHFCHDQVLLLVAIFSMLLYHCPILYRAS